jgi:hypothetical protein
MLHASFRRTLRNWFQESLLSRQNPILRVFIAYPYGRGCRHMTCIFAYHMDCWDGLHRCNVVNTMSTVVLCDKLVVFACFELQILKLFILIQNVERLTWLPTLALGLGRVEIVVNMMPTISYYANPLTRQANEHSHNHNQGPHANFLTTGKILVSKSNSE